LIAAAGWLRLSELGPVIVVGFGVVLGVGVADGAGVTDPAGDGAAAGAGLCAASGVAIGFAGAGFFCASSTTVSFIASVTGMWATPFVLSTHPYVVSAVIISDCAACNFSARALARFFSYVFPRGEAPITTSASKPKKAKSSTIPTQVENVERGWNFCVGSSGITSISCAERFENARIAHREQRSLADNPEVE
jgi:hypothetical protein